MNNPPIYKSDTAEHEALQRYRRSLDAWPVPCEHVRVPTRAGETFAVVSGPVDAPPLVLLHGSGANASTWRGDIGSWAQHFRTYAIDMVGEPGLSAPSRPPLDSDALARWLDDVLDALGIDRAALVGMSLGGWTALDYAIRRPARVTRLGLLCPGGVGRQTMGKVVASMLLLPFGPWGRRRSAAIMTGLTSPEAAPILDEVTQTFGGFKPRTERLPVFSDDALRTLALPILVLVGERDAMFDSAATAARMRRCVPHVQVEVLPGVGHAVLGQTHRILEFLRR